MTGLLIRYISLRSTDRGSSRLGGSEQLEQKAPRVRGLFSRCEQHTEQPGRKGVEQVINPNTSFLQHRADDNGDQLVLLLFFNAHKKYYTYSFKHNFSFSFHGIHFLKKVSFMLGNMY